MASSMTSPWMPGFLFGDVDPMTLPQPGCLGPFLAKVTLRPHPCPLPGCLGPFLEMVTPWPHPHLDNWVLS